MTDDPVAPDADDAAGTPLTVPPPALTVPPSVDESCRHRETVRFPPTTSRDLQTLVDDGTYPNRSAAVRAGVRLLVAHHATARG